MNKMKVIKFAAGWIVGYGTGQIVRQIIVSNVTPKTSFQKITMTAAIFVIASMAAAATKKYTDETIEEFEQNLNNARKRTIEVLDELHETVAGDR